MWSCCRSSCVMNHVLNVLLCSFTASLVFTSMISNALLDSLSDSSFALLWFFMYEFVSVRCRLVATLCSAWMLLLLQFGCCSVNRLTGISGESPSACLIMQRLILLLPDYWILNFFLQFPGEHFCSVMNLCDFLVNRWYFNELHRRYFNVVLVPLQPWHKLPGRCFWKEL